MGTFRRSIVVLACLVAGLIVGAPVAAAVNNAFTLQPSSGAPGDEVRVGGCPSVAAATWGSSTEGAVRSRGTVLVVPDVKPGEYSVSITCVTSGGGDSETSTGTASFTVVAPPSAEFVISAEAAFPGDTIKGRGTGYPADCDPTVAVRGKRVQADTSGSRPGNPAVAFTLPDNSAPGPVSVRLTCGGSSADAPLRVLARPTVRLDRAEGLAGTAVVATGANYPARCQPSLQIDGRSVPVTTSSASRLVVSFTVPTDLKPGAVTVRLTCGEASAEARFQVLPTPAPTLVVEPGKGRVEVPVTARGSDFPLQCTPAVQIGGQSVPVTVQAGGPVVSFRVPKDLRPGVVTVRLTCGDAFAEAPFEVLPAPVPKVVLEPGQGRVDTPVTARGSDFPLQCTPAVQVGGLAVSVAVQAGGPVVLFRVPKDLRPGAATVRLTCGDAFAEARFEVLATPVPAVVVDPAKGRVGASVTVRGSEFPLQCGPAVQIAGLSVPLTRQSGKPGGPVVSFTVPKDLGPGAVTVRLTCGDAFAEAPFEVLPTPVPKVVLEPGQGRVDTPVTVRGSDFPLQCTPAVQVGGRSVPVTVQPGGQPGSPVVTFTVPKELQAGGATVRLTCGEASAEAPFDVLPAPVPAVVLEPGTAAAGEPVTVRGTDYPSGCESTVRVAGNAVAATSRSDSKPGSPVLSFTVPNGLLPGAVPVRLDCGQAAVETPLQLLAVSSPIPPTSSPSTPLGENPDRPSFPRELPTAHEVIWTLDSLAKSLGVFLALFVIVGFPAELFNKTLEENRDRLPSWWRRDPLPENATGAGWRHLAGYVLGSAVLLSLVESGAGLNVQTLILAVGFLISVPLTTLAYSGSAELYLQRAYRAPSSLRVLPLGFVIAVVCVALSRFAEFQPGYAYGLFAFFAMAAAVARRRERYEGASVVVGATVLLVTGVAAWVVWTPVDEVASRPDATPLVLVVDSVLATTFVLALQGVAFGLAPVEYMDGKKLWDWKKGMWAATWGISVFLFVHVLFWKFVREWNGDIKVVIAAVAPFVLFGLISFGLWIYLRVTASFHSSAAGR